MAHPDKPLDKRDVLEFDRIDQWGAELRRVLAGVLPKNLKRVFAAEPPDDMEHAGAILLAQVSTTMPVVMQRISLWIRKMDVVAYLPMRLEPGEVADVREHGISLTNGLHRMTRIEKVLHGHPSWGFERHRLRDVVETTVMRERRFRRPYFGLCASRSCLERYFDNYPNEYETFEALVAKSLLGSSAVPLVSDRGDRYLVKMRMNGGNALSTSKGWSKRGGRRQPNFARNVFDAWAYWLADPEFSPGDECLFIGLRWRGDISARDILGIAPVAGS